MRYITETKNLFDISSAKKVSGGPSFSKNGNQITVSYSRAETWKSANVLLDTSLVGKTISVTTFAMTSGLNKTYIRIQWLSNNGLAGGSNIASNMITGNSFQKLTLTGVVPESPGGDFTNLCIMFYSNTNNYSLENGATYSATFTNIQLELGDTATPYVPYGYLPMRRMKYKQNDVCQLLDKSKYPATATINGVTFTNNGDGTITLDGTGNTYAAYRIFLSGTLNETHKYLFTAASQQCAWGQTYGITCTNSPTGFDNGNGKIFTNVKRLHLVVYVWKQNSVSNLVFKPQLFDLTEMYGAGNEPTTVEEFKADFPEDLYEYTPYCWASMKNIRYLDTTKNLFNAKAIKKTSIKVNIDGSVIIIPQGNSPNGYTSTSTTLSELCPNLKVGDTAILNFKTTSAYGHYIWLSPYYERSWHSGDKRIITEEMLNSVVIMYGANIANGETGQVIITNFQIELGDTATDYVPYGYLPLN